MATPLGMKVLVTGASGNVGQAFRNFYRDYYSLRLTCHQSPLEPSANEEVVQADITDFQSILKAMEGIEVVVHLAADSTASAPWESVMKLNIEGTYNVFEAARRSEVKKVIFASSSHACGLAVKESGFIESSTVVRPDSFYGVSKVFGEALGRYYADKFGLSVICLRIGAFRLGDPEVLFKAFISGKITHPFYVLEELMEMWISERDIAQLIHRSIETDLKFGVFYGTSDNERKVFDISDTKEKLGYKPLDRVEDYLPHLHRFL